ncbi:hypothetical protein [Aeromicrobium fastidiosum]|uniref:Uncharacterized protein n=1 Tax=Aeromicrobium fastidiosum TaxID=52699 RepID=A0A641AR00_9ACTN|nr:hypothetical protein [Aeromicrobium fastidiosum]KAA1380520.1 hypothetical protein ESP62_004910 [Aeromicrobium fastidiosum]MBP2390112.1 hypothetical protein [Aeromicrobium fastidiosum]
MAIKSYIVGPGSLIFGSPGAPDEMAAQITSCTATPSVDIGDVIPVLSGEELPGDREVTWVLEGNFLQDITETGITTYTLENSGQQKPFVYIPNNIEGRSLSGNVVIDPTAIGGDVKARATADFEFSIIGEPALGDVAP